MNNFRMLIEYDGGRYKGWQRLGGGENTIQEKIENVLTELTGEAVEIIGCSRTDAGVHAYAQTANFKTGGSFTADQVKAYLNNYLPHDICVKEVLRVNENFHARYNAKAKTYLYRIWNRDYANPFMRKYSTHVKEGLDVTRMRDAARHFVGEHDFTAFSNAKSKKKSMTREIYSVTVEESEGFVLIRLRGSGFLYNMARKMVGTIIAAGLGKENPDAIPEIIASRDRGRALYMAEACGLYLENIEY